MEKQQHEHNLLLCVNMNDELRTAIILLSCVVLFFVFCRAGSHRKVRRG